MASCFEDTNIQTLLEKIAKDEGFENPKFIISSATNPGENFIGQVFRVKIEDSESSLSLIFKVSSPNKARKEKFQSDVLFCVEAEMYETVLPALNDLLKKRGLSNSPIFPGTTRCYATSVNRGADESDVIVLEDKKASGYSIGSLKNGLDEAQCRLALQKVALLHSSYIALQVLEPETGDRLNKIFDRTIWRKGDPIMVDFRAGYLKGLDLLGERYTSGDPIYEKLHAIYDDFDDEFFKLIEVPGHIACVNHGDFWANNVLYKLNQDDIAEDACLIDFQISSIQSPITDIAVFLFVCTTKEVRDRYFDDLIQFYYDELTKTVLECGCNPESVVPWTKFLEHLRVYSKVGVITAIASLPVLMADKSEIQGDIHSTDADATLFCDTVKITNPETLRDVSERLIGVVEDAEEFGYI